MVPKNGDSLDFALLEAVPDLTLVVDAEGQIVFANREADRVLGIPSALLRGKSFVDILPLSVRIKHAAELATYFDNPELGADVKSIELVVLRSSKQEIPVELRLAQVETKHGPMLSVVLRERSEQRRLKAELLRARAEGEVANKAKSDFLSSMSHEFRTPLNAIIGFAQLVLRDRRDLLPLRHRVRVEQILESGDHLLALVNDILDLAEIETLGATISPQSVRVDDAIRAAMVSLEPSASKAGVILRPPTSRGGELTVTADRARLVQILTNFGTNAIKYNRRGGEVSIASSMYSSNEVRVTVADNGIGIAPSNFHKLFLPFQRIGRESGPIEGAGIGLLLAKKLAASMGGRVGFRSEVGRGSEFWVELPVAVQQSRAPAVTHMDRSVTHSSPRGSFGHEGRDDSSSSDR